MRRSTKTNNTRLCSLGPLTSVALITLVLGAEKDSRVSLNFINHTLQFNNSISRKTSQRHLMPRRQPHHFDYSKRIHASPLKIGSESKKKKQINPVRQSPYYPSLDANTCLNDNNYPKYFLYDVHTYFFQSPKECCERHFGKSVGKKGGGLLKSGNVKECLAPFIQTMGQNSLMTRSSINNQQMDFQQVASQLKIDAKTSDKKYVDENRKPEGAEIMIKGNPIQSNPHPSASKPDKNEQLRGNKSNDSRYRSNFSKSEKHSNRSSSKFSFQSNFPPSSSQHKSQVLSSLENGVRDSIPLAPETGNDRLPPKRPPLPKLYQSSSLENSEKKVKSTSEESSLQQKENNVPLPPNLSPSTWQHDKAGKAKSIKGGKSKSAKYDAVIARGKGEYGPVISNSNSNTPTYMPTQGYDKLENRLSNEGGTAFSTSRPKTSWYVNGNDNHWRPTSTPNSWNRPSSSGKPGGKNSGNAEVSPSQSSGTLGGSSSIYQAGHSKGESTDFWSSSSSTWDNHSKQSSLNTPISPGMQEGNWAQTNEASPQSSVTSNGGSLDPEPEYLEVGIPESWNSNSSLSRWGNDWMQESSPTPGNAPTYSDWNENSEQAKVSSSQSTTEWGGSYSAPEPEPPGKKSSYFWDSHWSPSGRESSKLPGSPEDSNWQPTYGYHGENGGDWKPYSSLSSWGTSTSSGKPGGIWQDNSGNGGFQDFNEKMHNGWGSGFMFPGPNSNLGAWGSDYAHPGSELGSGWGTSSGDSWWGGWWGGIDFPSFSKPTAKPITLKPITKKPITMKPTAKKSTTKKPTAKKSNTKKPTVKKPKTKKPTAKKSSTKKPIGKSSRKPTKDPTPIPSGADPTYMPTDIIFTYTPSSSEIPPLTYMPTLLPTQSITSTYAPTSFATTMTPLDFFVWGSPKSSGEDSKKDILVPIDTERTAIDASAGSKYSVIVTGDGLAYSSGYIEALDNYQGHLGLQPKKISKGFNTFQQISRAFDRAKSGVTDPPKFERAFAGVENSPGTGSIHTILLDRQGRAWATGSNKKGQLCLGDEIDRSIPEMITLKGVSFVDVAIGGQHTLLLDESGNVYGCGSNDIGQLGLSEDTNSTNVPIVIPMKSGVSSISAGRDHSLFIAKNGIYVTGSNAEGQLCVDTNSGDVLEPLSLDFSVKAVLAFKAIHSSTFILFEDGSVTGCGKNDVGQLGDGTNKDSLSTTMANENYIVRLLGVGPSSQSIFLVTDDQDVYATGLNAHGQLGVGDLKNRNVPTKVLFENEALVEVLSAAEDHTLSLKKSESKKSPQPTPFPEATPSTAPTMIVTDAATTYLPTSTAPSIFPSSLPTYFSTFAPTEEGFTFFFWGNPQALGQKSEMDLMKPISIEDMNVSFSSAGSNYSLIVLRNGTVSSAGFINSLNVYKGHLGIEKDIVSGGINPLRTITNVQDINGTSIHAPMFEKVFAGVENTIASGIIHTILLDRQGNAYSVGSNSQGQLCLGDEEDRFIPVKINVEGRIVDVAIGGEHTLLLTEDGKVYACGSNAMGQIGLGDSVLQSSVPVYLDSISSVSSLSAGLRHSLFINGVGIYATGDNNYSQLCVDNGGQYITTPTTLNFPVDNVLFAEAIKFSSFFVYKDGSVNACGKNDKGQLGDGTNDDQILTNVSIGEVVRLLGVGPSSESVFFVTEDDIMYATGSNARGNLGVGDLVDRNTPTIVKFSDQVIVGVLSSSEDHTIALGLISGTLSPTSSVTMSPTPVSLPPTTTLFPTTVSLNLFVWGALENAGQTSSTDVVEPLFLDEDTVYSSAGSKYSIIVLRNGTALSAGVVQSLDNYYGYLGIGKLVTEGINDFRPISSVYDTDGLNETFTPVFDKAFAGAENIPGSGIMHTILLDRRGYVYSVGSNAKGQLCLGDEEDRFIPSRIPIEGRIIDVAVGGEHSLLLLEDGNVYVCGSNTMGQLGLGGSKMSSSYPVLLERISSVFSVSAGLGHSLFMGSSGLFVTGDNKYGQLCMETNSETLLEPQALDLPIDAVSSFEAIQSSSFILNANDGSVYACGRNDLGQLGDGTNKTVTFTTVAIESNIIRLLGVGPSSQSVFFITEDEEVYATGLNAEGNLGVGDLENRNLPTRVKFGEKVFISVLSAGENHTIALGSKEGSLAPTLSPTIGSTSLLPSTTPSLESTNFPSSAPSNIPSSSLSVASSVSPSEASSEVPSMVSSATPSVFPSMVPSVTSSAVSSLTPTIANNETLNSFSPSLIGREIPTSSPIITLPPIKTSKGDELFVWGAPESLGEAISSDITIPEMGEKRVIDLMAGSKYSLILLEDGTAQSAGFIDSIDDYHGHLGLKIGDITEGTNPFQTISNVFYNNAIIEAPVFTRVFAGVNQADAISAIHTFLIDNEGQAWTTGSNEHGQLCLGDFDDRLIPSKVPIDGQAVNVAIGAEHTILLMEDGTVYGCGSNEAGQLGLGSNIKRVSSPTRIAGLGSVQEVSAGLGSTYFVASDGLYVTGNNFYGQLCIDTNTASLFTPTILEGVNVGDVTSFQSIRSSSFILFNDGSIGACGRNNFGQLGDGSNDDKIRVVVKPLPNEIPIRLLGTGPSSESIFFVNDAGEIYSSGLNDRGQLGVGDNENRNVLTLVEFSSNAAVKQLSASADHAMLR